jgi:hypothetical protein
MSPSPTLVTGPRGGTTLVLTRRCLGSATSSSYGVAASRCLADHGAARSLASHYAGKIEHRA